MHRQQIGVGLFFLHIIIFSCELYIEKVIYVKLISFVRQYFNMYMFITVFIVGLYEAFIEPKFLTKKGLDKDSKKCMFIGYVYIFIGIIAIIILEIFPI